MSQNDQDEPGQFEEEGEALLIKGRVTKLEEEQEAARKHDEDYKQRQMLYNKRLALFTLLLVITSILANGIYLDMSCTARKSAESARTAANASAEASGIAAKALKDSEQSFSQTLRQMQEQTKAQHDSAKAASDSVATTKEVMKLDQRAWLAINPTPPVFDEVKLFVGETGETKVTAKLEIKNTGRTPARIVRGRIEIEVLHGFYQKPMFKYIPAHTAQILTPILAPNAAVTITLQGGMNLMDTVNQSTASVHGELRYCDVFDMQHWINFCLTWRPDLSIPFDLSQYATCEGVSADRNSIDDINSHQKCQDSNTP